jgi:hypothetical protein
MSTATLSARTGQGQILVGLLHIRTAQRRGERSPPMAAVMAARLRNLLVVEPQIGGAPPKIRLSHEGDAFLDLFFLFCRNPQCIGVLYRWTALRRHEEAVALPLLLGPIPGSAASSYFLKCPECQSLNVLDARCYPVSRSDFRIVRWIPGSAR